MVWDAGQRRIDANKYYDLGDVIIFDDNHGTMHASLRIPGELYFSGDRLKPIQLSTAELSRFEGDFHSEELLAVDCAVWSLGSLFNTSTSNGVRMNRQRCAIGKNNAVKGHVCCSRAREIATQKLSFMPGRTGN